MARFVGFGLLAVAEGGYGVADWWRYFPKDRTAAERKRRSRERRAYGAWRADTT